MSRLAASFDEIRALAASLPDPRGGAVEPINHPRLVLFAASHGIAADLPGGSPHAMAETVRELVDGQGALHRMVEEADCDLRLYELALEQPTRDSRRSEAFDEVEASRAAAYGMMAVEPGIDVFIVAALGAGAELAGTALVSALLGGRADAAHASSARTRHAVLDDPLELLAALGGPDIAAILGVILATRLAGAEVVLDGAAAWCAAAVARRLHPDALEHCRAAVGTIAGMAVDRLDVEAVLSRPGDSPFTGLEALMVLRARRSG